MSGQERAAASAKRTHRRETPPSRDLPRKFSPPARQRFAALCADSRCCRETALPRAAGPKPACVATAAAAPAPGRPGRVLAQARALPHRSSVTAPAASLQALPRRSPVAAPAASLQLRRCCALGRRPRRAGARRAAPGPKEPAWSASPAAPCARPAQRRRRHTSQPQAAAAARALPRGSAAPRREACRVAQRDAIAVKARRWRTGGAPLTGRECRGVARNGPTGTVVRSTRRSRTRRRAQWRRKQSRRHRLPLLTWQRTPRHAPSSLPGRPPWQALRSRVPRATQRPTVLGPRAVIAPPASSSVAAGRALALRLSRQLCWAVGAAGSRLACVAASLHTHLPLFGAASTFVLRCHAAATLGLGRSALRARACLPARLRTQIARCVWAHTAPSSDHSPA